MQWSDFLGHEKQIGWFRHAIEQGRLGSTFLLIGPSGIGKRTMARLLAKTVLCPNRPSGLLSACGRCESCVQIDAATHPDLLEVRKPDDKSVLPIELFVGPRELRGREGLIYELSLKPYYGRGRIAIIDDADYFNEESANCLLKTLEEPPSGVRIFLIGTSLQKQLPTIRSRSQVVRFQGLSEPDFGQLLSRLGVENGSSQLTASQCEGSLTNWHRLNDPELLAFREGLLTRLSQRPIEFVGLAKAMTSALDQFGKEGAERRDRLKLIFGFAIDFYRAAWWHQETRSYPANCDDTIRHAVHVAASQWLSGRHGPVKAIQRSLEAIREVDRNAAPAGLLEAWAADIASICGA